MDTTAKGHRRRLVIGWTALVLGLSGAPALAAQSDKGMRGEVDAQVLSGGVGAGERAKLEEQARDHNLKLLFTLSTGNYLAEVPFTIERGGKVVAEHTARGPWAFAKLPAGNYTIKATHEGKTLTRQVTAPKTGQKRVAFTWPAPERVAEQPKGRGEEREAGPQKR